MAVWSTGQATWTPSAPLGFGGLIYDGLRFSDLGAVAGGSTVAAGSALPATHGRIIPNHTAVTDQWVRISGTAARAGDAVYCTFQGRRTASPTNPATRIQAASGPGAPGATILPDGTIEIVISGQNSDENFVAWYIARKP